MRLRAFFSGLLLAGVFVAAASAASPLKVYTTAPEFVLTERSGKTVTEADLKGEVWIADFIFTRCAGICPLMTSKMYELQESLEGVRFVSFTVDPEYDTPLVLSQYAEAASADPERWYFLTGDTETMNRVTTSFYMNKIDEPMMHSSRFVLVDREGQVRGFYDSADEARLKELRRDAASLLT